MQIKGQDHLCIARSLQLALAAWMMSASPIFAAQVDLVGPAGSVAFGTSITALPNGNFVVTDPSYSTASASNIGALYLYRANGSLISTLTGATANDRVGSGGVAVLSNGNLIVGSPHWSNGTFADAGAVTWLNGETGLNGSVSSGNSLVGTAAGEIIGQEINHGAIAILSNGNCVIPSLYWVDPGTGGLGAATWIDGTTGISGPISTSNSLVVGSSGYPLVEAVALSNGNYVVVVPYWNNGSVTNAGAATWGNGLTGTKGYISAINSLVGTQQGDSVGGASGTGVVALSNGNYVVVSPGWNNGGFGGAGAVTWGDGKKGVKGPVSTSNSLVGVTVGDAVGSDGVTALTNGNYVVASSYWYNPSAVSVGAVTWANENAGLTGAVSADNSLIGTTSGDRVGYSGVTALSNGSYVVASPEWNNGSASRAGAVTWSSGATAISGQVSPDNSLVGADGDDQVGSDGVTALTNGNYVVASSLWTDGVSTYLGAITFGSGVVGVHGAVSSTNSFVGSTAYDSIGSNGIFALSDGNYVASSPNWSFGTANNAGATTWMSGASGLSGKVSASNSLVGTIGGDSVGRRIAALSNGNYAVASSFWSSATTSSVGAVTFLRDGFGYSGTVSASNSLVGSTFNDQVGATVEALGDGNYAVTSPAWTHGSIANAGAITLASGLFRLVGTVQPWNSVLGGIANGGATMVFDYDVKDHQLIVGRPAENIVSLFTMDQIFADNLEP